jgi:hypothetical protein
MPGEAHLLSSASIQPSQPRMQPLVEGSFPGSEMAWPDHLPPNSAEVKIAWSFTSTPHTLL